MREFAASETIMNRVNHKVGYIKVYLETTREMGRTILIRYHLMVSTER